MSPPPRVRHGGAGGAGGPVVQLMMLLHSAISAGTYLAAKRGLAEVGPFELALGRLALGDLARDLRGAHAWTGGPRALRAGACPLRAGRRDLPAPALARPARARS